MNESAIKLATCCEYAIRYPDWQPKVQKDSHGKASIVTTYCNLAVDYVASKMGCEWFKDKTANEIYETMVRNFPKFTEITFPLAAKTAMEGGLVIAAQRGAEHGHVAILYPSEMEMSGTFNCLVPTVANVGRTNGIMRLSQAFRLDPYPKCFCFRN